MRKRYQVGTERFETLDQALQYAAICYVNEPGPPQFVLDRANKQLVGIAALVKLLDLMAGKTVQAGDIPTFTDHEGNVHLGVRA